MVIEIEVGVAGTVEDVAVVPDMTLTLELSRVVSEPEREDGAGVLVCVLSLSWSAPE